MPGLGDEFRAAREARHLSLSDVSEQIHIRSVYLQSIEDEDWSAAVAPVYVRGFVRTYARFLGLDTERAAAYVMNALSGSEAAPAPESSAYEPPPAARRSLWLWAATLVAGCLVAFVAYNYFMLQATDTVAPPAIVGFATAHPARSGGTLEVRLTRPSSLTVTVDGTQALAGDFPAGLRRSFRGKLATVRTGNAAGVSLTVNGKDLGTLGAPGSTVDRSLSLAEE